ncbi:MAG: ABC transporter ATP-binding protein [Cohaesibacteraceae bacterium]|nr:ABC transporter ATP-binding protein [Cohaesibacteraceae bacterium]MBL4876582.1 ABC transporter ATP-binding protein [Cohaesibacteraceae bacterium]
MLEIKNLSVRYGKHLALNSINFEMKTGISTVILGANGAGKSTLLKAIGGACCPENGTRISFNGLDLLAMEPHQIVNQGIALVPEGRGIFEQMTVEENLSLGAFPPRARRNEKQQSDMVYTMFPKLAERRKQGVHTMSGGEQQMVAIGRALMSCPDLLLLDEPSLGLAPVLVQELFLTLEKIGQTGMSMLIVEQNVKASLQLVDFGYLLEAGQIVGSGAARLLLNDDAIKKTFLGASARANEHPGR